MIIFQTIKTETKKRTTMATTTQAAQQPTATNGVAPSNNEPIYIDTQHDDMVHDAQLDYYGCKLATSSSGTCIVYIICAAKTRPVRPS